MIRYIAFLLTFVLGVAALPALAQSDEDETFEREISYGVNLNSNGGLIGGAFVRLAYTMNEKMLQFGALEIVEVKHPREQRYYNPYTGDSFIGGKQNYLFVVRPHYGRELVLFRKAAESGVQVNAIGAVGPSLGLLVPYYIRYDYGQQVGDDVRTEHYDPAIHKTAERIQGSSGFFTGLSEPNVNVGAHIKGGLSFEYGRYNESIAGIEVGVMLEAYPKELVIIPQAKNTSHFTSVYLNIFYGSRK